jgi:hypothetical protein
MLPLPAPLVAVVRVNFGVKVAVAFTVDVPMVNEQVLVPEQAPLQPVNTKPEAGVAVRVTAAPELKLPEQLDTVHVMPAGLLATEPEPDNVTLTGNDAVSKLALTNCTAFMVTTQAPVPEHPPPVHPVNTEPTAALALSVTESPWL